MQPQTANGAPQSTAKEPAIDSSPRKWLRSLSRINLAVLLLTYITVVHLTGLYIFTRGFLLTRLSIPLTTPPYSANNPAAIPPTHSKAVILIIDALRTDFISPHHPIPPSPYHHGVLTLPAELTAQCPDHSLIFNTFSDPPTTTMQRIKGMMTGSLPTFVDAGTNFASTAIEEDSLISQLVAADKKVVFMGDDTWANLFPNSFTHAHPYDSFNVEDLHTVDNGVIEHLFPYMHPSNSSEWDVLIGHFLGVDHVGHRVGPEKDTMKAKLTQMDEVLRRVVDLLDDDTLLVLLGDHGMDPKGNHGGDSELETAAALWLYSKDPPLTGDLRDEKLLETWPTYTSPGSRTALRHINQIDLLPTLTYLLGLPIPFNNLGMVVPEVFSNLADLETATRLNTRQIIHYLEEYGDEEVLAALRGSFERSETAATLVDRAETSMKLEPKSTKWYKASSGSGTANEIELLQAQHHSIVQHRKTAAEALEQLRALWAQFSVPTIVFGASILALSIPVLYGLYAGVKGSLDQWPRTVCLAFEPAYPPSLVAGTITLVISIAFFHSSPRVAVTQAVGVCILVSEIIMCFLLLNVPRPWLKFSLQSAIGPLILVLHTLSFASNSFIMWEDRMLLFFFCTIPLVHLFKAFTAPTNTMRIRIALLSLAILAIARLIGSITVCREEQQPYCRVTFFSGSTATAPTWALLGSAFVAFQLPRVIGVTLNQSKSLAGPAPIFLGVMLRVVLLLTATYWILEWLEFFPGLVAERIPLVRTARTWIARVNWVSIIAILPYHWSTSPLCIKVERNADQSGEKAVTVFGFANAYGSTYLLFSLIPFASTHLVAYPVAQVTLVGVLCMLLAHLEVTDTQRDAQLMADSFAASTAAASFDPTTAQDQLATPSFTESTFLALLGLLSFFSTGHQAVLTSIQWKAAFVGFETVTYPFSPLFVILNTWGPIALSALAVPLLALWNVSPRPQSSVPLLGHILQLVLAFMIYHASITFASAFFAAWLRRHLMVWKVFAPRFMLAGVTLLVVDVCLIVAVAIGARVTAWKVWQTFKCAMT